MSFWKSIKGLAGVSVERHTAIKAPVVASDDFSDCCAEVCAMTLPRGAPSIRDIYMPAQPKATPASPDGIVRRRHMDPRA